jgi:replicative DNA helicase
MNAEQQIIGSLLLNQSRIDDMHSINSEMFVNPLLGEIFSIYEHADGKEVNRLAIASRIKSECYTEQSINSLLVELINNHDSGISDRYCVNDIYDRYRTRKLNEFLDRIRLSPENIDLVIEECRETIDGLQKIENHNVGKTISELTQYKTEYFKEKSKRGLNLGFSKLDKAIGGIDNGDVVVIAARPAVGKSAFALQMIRKFGKDGYKVGYFNLEMGERQLYERIVAATSEIDMTRIRLANCFLGNEQEKFEQGNKKMEQETNVHAISGTQSIASLRQIQKEKNFQVIVVDYLQLLQSTNKRQNRSSEVGDISRGLKAIATDFNIPVIALSQLNRASELNKDKEPNMSELRESGDIEQDASVVIMLWNPNSDDLSEKKIKIEKSRNGYVDRETLYFDGKHMTFTTIDNENTSSEKHDDFRQATIDDDIPDFN